MLQHLLAERFNPTVHKEKRDLPVYALIVANDNLAPGRHKSAARCDVPGAGAQPGRTVQSPSDPRLSHVPPCGLRRSPGILSGTGITMAQLVAVFAQRRGVDQ